MCSPPSLYFSCIPRGCKFISEEHQGKEKKLQQNPAMLGCINLHNSKWPTFAFHAWRPETRAWIIQDKSGGGTKTQRNGHRPLDRKGHSAQEWGRHWKVTFNRPTSKLPQKTKHFLKCDLFTSVIGPHSVWGRDSIFNHKEMERSEFKTLGYIVSRQWKYKIHWHINTIRGDFPGSPVVKNLPSKAA